MKLSENTKMELLDSKRKISFKQYIAQTPIQSTTTEKQMKYSCNW
jgi:hypothetical protein